MGNFINEMEGQIDFYNLIKIVDGNSPTIEDNTDGIIKGTLIEFKLSISNINIVLFQTIKYLSRMRNLGKSIPSQILLISLNNEKAYLFKSIDFLEQIETQYIGGASTNNKSFSTTIKSKTIEYKNNLIEIIELLKSEDFIKVHVDKHNIVGLSKAYYEIINDGSYEMKIEKKYKLEFVDELVEPKYLNIFTYADNRDEVYEKSKKEFPGLIDCLNDKFLQKELGAFYTPDPYVQKATELLRVAISKIPKGNDYIILDRCSGTGQLENFLTEEELSHCVLSTYETWEWNVLYNKFIDKVRLIIPPEVSAENSLVEGGDALSRHFILGERTSVEHLQDSYKACIKQLNDYVKNPNCNIIIFENPPYRDKSAQIKDKNTSKTFIYEEFKSGGTNQASHRELANLFIWSSFKYYLKKEDDFLLLFGPIKYWKSINLVNKKFIDGYGFNRKYFHAGKSFISCILWQNIDKKLESINLKAFDIEEDEIKNIQKQVKIKKVYKQINTLKDSRKFESDTDSDVFCDLSGIQSSKVTDKKSKYNSNIIGYLRSTSFNLDANSVALTRLITYDALTQVYGFYFRSDNFVDKLPLFCAKLYPQENWYERDVYFTTADRGEDYLEDKDFLKSCLIFTCLSQRNKCLSFDGSDKRFYKNELCLSQDTLSDNKLKDFNLSNRDKNIIKLWDDILGEAKKTNNYNEQYTYGLFQIIAQLNTYCYNGKSYTKDEITKLKLTKTEKKAKYIEYIELNTKIDELKKFLKEYYKKQVQDKLFEYELLK